jgi:hypothetical protein
MNISKSILLLTQIIAGKRRFSPLATEQLRYRAYQPASGKDHPEHSGIDERAGRARISRLALVLPWSQRKAGHDGFTDAQPGTNSQRYKSQIAA